ncbi:hypothetical protein [Nocardia sp. NPDC057030]|uniref:hypothetical protein n=1 Tax=unclassified Nocardia TaxID=2637762 RepID=UPI00362E4C25
MHVPGRRGSAGIATVAAALACIGLGMAPSASAENDAAYFKGRVDVCKTNGYDAVAGWTGGRNGHPVDTIEYQWDNANGYTYAGQIYKAGNCLRLGEPQKAKKGVFRRVTESYGDDGHNDGYSGARQYVRGGEFQRVDAW